MSRRQPAAGSEDEPSAATGCSHCRVCGGGRLVPHLLAAGETLDRCLECGFVQIRHEPSPQRLDRIYSDAYFASAKYRDARALAMENARRLRLVDRFVPAGARVLDAGCATGDFIAAAAGRYEMYGLDLSAFAVALARTKNPGTAARIHAGRLEDAPFADVRFDAICLWDVIEHLWDPVAVTRYLVAHLNVGGHLLLSTPAIDAPLARLTGRYWPFMTPPEHMGFHGRRSFAAMFPGRVPADIVSHARHGKWANVAFIGYKIGRVAPRWFPAWPATILQSPPLRGLNLYVPTGDIQYLAVRARAAAP